MKNLIYFILCVIVISAFVLICDNSKTANTTTKSKIAKNLSTNLSNIDYSIKDLSDIEVEYLKTGEYKDFYEDKKLVIYYVGADCPYAKAFIKAINPLKSNPEYYTTYNFYPEKATRFVTYNSMSEAKAATSFNNACQSFCVVNPKTNQIFAIDGIGTKEAQQIGSILDNLKDW